MPEASAGRPDPQPAALAELARTAAEAAATMLVDRWQELHHQIATKSTVTDAVTAADRLAEAMIRDHIAAVRPHDAVLGEEGGEVAGDDRLAAAGPGDRPARVRWIVDPLDGTVNYVYGLPGFAVSIAAELNGEVVAGVVVDAVRGETYLASKGAGAQCNGEPLAVSAETDPGRALVATGFGYDARRRAAQAAVVATLLPQIRDIRRLGAAAVDICHAARGRVDAYYEYGLSPWDYAAGALIAAEAGAVVSDFAGGPASPAGCLVAPPALHAALLTLLVAAGIPIGPAGVTPGVR